MIFNFDLISDIHRETWNHFDWTGQPTAPYCIVAGDIARDRALVIDTLEQLSEVYQGVFYIDGNDEHKDYAIFHDYYLHFKKSYNSQSSIKCATSADKLFVFV